MNFFISEIVRDNGNTLTYLTGNSRHNQLKKKTLKIMKNLNYKYAKLRNFDLFYTPFQKNFF